jgi:GNAT superfamily N-acetyltransferase
MNIEIKLAESDADLERLAPVLSELRPQFTSSDLIARIKEQQKQGYLVAFAESGGEVLGVAGFVVGRKLAWGKHIYVDDLVTAERSRSKGVGGQLIKWLKAYARDQGCEQKHLDSGVQRFGAHRFYLRNRFDIASHHFSTEDLGGVLPGST